MPSDPLASPSTPGDRVVVAETHLGRLQLVARAPDAAFIVDEPVSAGGLGTGPNPYDLLAAALASCTALTLRLYADRKKLPLTRTLVRLRHSRIYGSDCAECETKEGKLDRIECIITLEGDLDADARKRLLEIADRCPVHRTLKSEIDIRMMEG